MAWSVDRLGRSLQDLVAFHEHLPATRRVVLAPAGSRYDHSGRPRHVRSVFAEFERAMIRERVKAGMARAVERGTKSGRLIGRPSLPAGTRLAICIVCSSLAARPCCLSPRHPHPWQSHLPAGQATPCAPTLFSTVEIYNP